MSHTSISALRVVEASDFVHLPRSARFPQCMRGISLVSFRSVAQQAQSDCRPAITVGIMHLAAEIQYTAMV